MPDFIAGLLAAATFCLGFTALNALTRLAGPIAPDDLSEAGLLQYGLAGLLACAAWRHAAQMRPVAVRD